MTGATPYRAALTGFIRYVAVGAATSGLYFALLFLFADRLGWSPAGAAGAAYIIAVAANYFAHHRWTFRSDEPHRATAPRYLMLVVLILMTNVTATGLLPSLLGVNYVVVQLTFAAILVAATFAVQAFWVFRKREG